MFRKYENNDFCPKKQTWLFLNPLNCNLSKFRVDPTIIRMDLLISQYRFINLVWKLLTGVIATHVQIRHTFSENRNVMIRHMIITRSNRYARSDSAYFLSPAPPAGATLAPRV